MPQSPFDPALTQELLQREMDKEDTQKRFATPPEAAPSPVTALSPKMAMLLGQAADSASTLHFLTKKDPGHEANPALQFFNKSPLTVIPTAVAGNVGYGLLHKLLSKVSPKAADTAAGLLGGYHMGLGASNMQSKRNGGISSYQNVIDKLTLDGKRK